MTRMKKKRNETPSRKWPLEKQQTILKCDLSSRNVLFQHNQAESNYSLRFWKREKNNQQKSVYIQILLLNLVGFLSVSAKTRNMRVNVTKNACFVNSSGK